MNAHDTSLHRHVPENIAAEQALLGAIFVNNTAFDRVSGFLEPKHFYEPLHRTIYQVCGDLIRQGKAANPVLIKSFLPADEKVGDMTVSQYLARLAASAVTVINAVDYARAIYDLAGRRELIAIGDGIIDVAYDVAAGADVLDGVSPFEDRLGHMRSDQARSMGRKALGQEYLEDMNAANQRGELRGVPLVLPEIGDVISEPCLEAANLYGLLSSSGEGKTSLTIQMIAYALRAGHPVQFQSFDQSRIQCVRQMVAQELGIEARRQRNPRKLLSEKEWEQCVEFATWLDKQPFEVVKCTDQSAPQLVGYARAFVKRYANGKVPLIVTDHIGSVRPEDKRADEGTKAKDINKVFKAGAEQTDSAWLVLNQRNSYGMRRDNPRPISADLFGGDPAKQAYDAILYLYRQEKFKAERIAIAASDSDWKKINKVFGTDIDGLAEIGAIKVRFGSPIITRNLQFEDRFTRYRSENPPAAQSELLEAYDG